MIAMQYEITLPAGYGYTSIELKVNYLRAVHASSGPLTAVGTVVKPGRRVAFSEGEVRDAAGKVVATATSSLLAGLVPVRSRLQGFALNYWVVNLGYAPLEERLTSAIEIELAGGRR